MDSFFKYKKTDKIISYPFCILKLIIQPLFDIINLKLEMIGGCMNKVYNTQKDIARGFEKFF